MVSARPDAASIILLLDLKIGLSLKTLAGDMSSVLLGTVRQGHLVYGPRRVLHAHVIGIAVLLASLMTTALHRQTGL